MVSDFTEHIHVLRHSKFPSTFTTAVETDLKEAIKKVILGRCWCSSNKVILFWREAKCLFPVKHIPLNMFPVCKSVVEEQWRSTPNTTVKQNRSDQCLVPRRKWCCYQSEMINNAEGKLWDSNPSSPRLRSEAVKRAPLAGPTEPWDNETGFQPQLWVTPVPEPTSPHRGFSPASRQPSISEGHRIKQKAISVAEPWKETNSQDLEFSTESQDFLICREKQEQLKVSNHVQLLSSRFWWNINKFHIRALARARCCLFVLGNSAFIFEEDVIKAHFKKLPLAPSFLFDYILAQSPASHVEPLSQSSDRERIRCATSLSPLSPPSLEQSETGEATRSNWSDLRQSVLSNSAYLGQVHQAPLKQRH